MSRFGDTMEFDYQPGTNWALATQFFLTQSQMPEYPFEEYRLSDRVVNRNLNGDAFTYQNYNKVGYKFKWTLQDEAMTGTLRTMFDANPYITFYSNSSNFGTFLIAEPPSITEVQFELYDIELNLIEA